MGLTWLPIDIKHQAVLTICSLIFGVRWCELAVRMAIRVETLPVRCEEDVRVTV